ELPPRVSPVQERLQDEQTEDETPTAPVPPPGQTSEQPGRGKGIGGNGARHGNSSARPGESGPRADPRFRASIRAASGADAAREERPEYRQRGTAGKGDCPARPATGSPTIPASLSSGRVAQERTGARGYNAQHERVGVNAARNGSPWNVQNR